MPLVAIGSSDGKLPPADAIQAVRTLIAEYIKAAPAYPRFTHPTLIDAHLLEAWRIAAGDPDDQVFLRLTQWAPAGILRPLEDPGIFPVCASASDMLPGDLHCDAKTFANYPGVEKHEARVYPQWSHDYLR